ncbi:ABC transporter permease subunit [Paenirhodobacter populi]|uniref:ABC transporter permease subunit n=1 Tax=Paenirhodobacter populi TaxID=2306993 RepID=A0A443JNS9_9RHOB|nr:ABC transporter permease subunit [Sinirhodobacter populi]RWR22181.1 ABC transporter permease subunit [Sinirhodobacter populi]
MASGPAPVKPAGAAPRHPARAAVRTLTAQGWPARIAAILVAAAILGPLAAVIRHAGGLSGLGSGDIDALWFTLWQAAVSAVLSCLLAVPVARALARRRFPGRGLLISLMGAPFILPTVVAAMGLVAVFGRRGMVNAGLEALGLPGVTVYGAQGVILAHVFLNLPLAVRMVLHGWQAVPSERLRLAAALGFGRAEVARHIERPMLRAVLPGAFLAIFLVCLTSFAIALTLGGGPRATTVELAIYQAFRFDADAGRAAALALVQIGVSVIALLASLALTAPPAFGAGLDRADAPPVRGARVKDALVLGAATLFLLLPLATILLRGLPALFDLPPSILRAAGTSVAIALGSTVLTLALALPLALAAPRARWAEVAGTLPMTASSLVLGTGLFLILRPFVNPVTLALPVTLLANALMSLPFALRLLMPEARALRADYDRLAASLGLRGLARLRLLDLPRLARPLGFSAGLAAAFSMGDLGVITLFSDGQRQTLPLALYQLMGAYRMDLAAAAACLLMALTFALFWAFDRIGQNADPR